ncbi:MAG: primosomal protein N' [Verrucomicrobia bacterium]|nr:primosomal protein N' [Verrucomicrobiota bacterium]
MSIAHILIDRTEGTILDYEIPAALQGKVVVGSRVAVPLRRQEVFGTVLELRASSEFSNIKALSRILISEEAPLLSPQLMKLAEWMADYYVTPLHTVLRSLLPGSIREAKKKRKAKDELFFGETILPIPPPTLNSDQERVVNVIGEVLQKYHELAPKYAISGTDPFAFLLHGVTGSGKTEVYLRCIEKALALGRSALVLVPEIALTPQTVERFRGRFERVMGKKLIAVLHSHLSEGERHEEWLRLHRGEARIAIGARSAVFAPLQNLGLIIIDEEHEGSYKQEEAPRYHARDVAVMRAYLEKCPIILGSATPSIESFHNVQIKKYRLLELPHRADHQKMPLVRVLDLRLQARGKQADGVLSFPLRQAIAARLEKSEQTILFLNRRGFASSLFCQQCGYVCECPHCSLALTFHRTSNSLVCHLCGLTKKLLTQCPECREPVLLQRGMGTQRVEAAIQQAFPEARLARMDTDTMKGKGIYQKTLDRFRSRQIDILIGTQMIAKGLDFPNVTLVGIINADTSLQAPDFRAGERTFQLLTQVAGRAGRGDVEGEVMIQTYTPVSPSIQFARHHDYHGFFEQEIVLRKQFGYPPFQRMILVQLRGKIQERVAFSAAALRKELRQALPSTVDVGEAVPAPLERAHGQYRFHIALKGTSVKKMGGILRSLLRKTSFPSGVITTIDVDPQSLL